jgi:hypothetical protein
MDACGGGGCGQTACGGGGCQGVQYDGQPIPDQGSGGNNPPPPPPDGGGAPSASLRTTNNVVIAAPQTYAPAYRTTNVTYRRGLFGRLR